MRTYELSKTDGEKRKCTHIFGCCGRTKLMCALRRDRKKTHTLILTHSLTYPLTHKTRSFPNSHKSPPPPPSPYSLSHTSTGHHPSASPTLCSCSTSSGAWCSMQFCDLTVQDKAAIVTEGSIVTSHAQAYPLHHTQPTCTTQGGSGGVCSCMYTCACDCVCASVDE